jgi:hypothetical protein
MKRCFFYPVALLFAMAALARAQIGNNWIQRSYSEFFDSQIDGEHTFIRQVPRHYLSPDGSCAYTNAEGVEEFRIFTNRCSRVEVRVQNDYHAPASGRQFEGDVMLLPPTGHESLVQIFGANDHATLFMLHGDSAEGGSLRHYDREVLATNVYNTWVRVNVIHIPGQFVQVYLNGEFKGQWWDNSEDHSHYFKYGCYGTLDSETAGVKWRNVKFFTGGEPPDAKAEGDK